MDPLLNKTSQLLRSSNGVVFGENHLDPNAANWITENLAQLKENGVETVFLEIAREQQPMLDSFATGSITEEKMRHSIRHGGASQANETAVEDIIVEAKRLGINIIAVDLNADPTPYKQDAFGRFVPDTYNDDRLQHSNPAWAERVNEIMAQKPEESKYIMLAGAAHTNKTDDFRYRGIDKILGIPSIDIYSADLVKKNNDLRSYGYGYSQIDPDIINSTRPIIFDHPEKNGGDFAAFVPIPTPR